MFLITCHRWTPLPTSHLHALCCFQWWPEKYTQDAEIDAQNSATMDKSDQRPFVSTTGGLNVPWLPMHEIKPGYSTKPAQWLIYSTNSPSLKLAPSVQWWWRRLIYLVGEYEAQNTHTGSSFQNTLDCVLGTHLRYFQIWQQYVNAMWRMVTDIIP